jgi:hypothetical protein
MPRIGAIDHSKDHMAARKRIAARACPDSGRPADPLVPHKDAV